MSFIAKTRKVICFILELFIFTCLMMFVYFRYLQHIPSDYYLRSFALAYLLYCGLGAMMYKYWMTDSEKKLWKFYPFVLSFFFVTVVGIICHIVVVIYKSFSYSWSAIRKSSLFFCKVFQMFIKCFRIFFNSLERFYLGT